MRPLGKQDDQFRTTQRGRLEIGDKLVINENLNIRLAVTFGLCEENKRTKAKICVNLDDKLVLM